jgi:hypothetical protein
MTFEDSLRSKCDRLLERIKVLESGKLKHFDPDTYCEATQTYRDVTQAELSNARAELAKTKRFIAEYFAPLL